MTDIEDASVNGNGEPVEGAPETPSQVESGPAPVAETPEADSVVPAAEDAAVAEPELEPAPVPAEQLALEVSEAPEVAAPAAGAAEAGVADELPEDLRALTESLEQPTGEMTAVAATEGEAAAAAEGEAAAAEPEAPATDSLDDIAPGTVAAVTAGGVAEAALGEVEPVRTTVSWWPFVGYVVVWLGAAAYAVWQLQQLPAGQAAYETNFYSMSVLAGLVLLAAGPVLLLIVWLASWIGRQGARIGLMFISALVKGAAATLLGALIWMGALLLIDYLRLGRPF